MDGQRDETEKRGPVRGGGRGQSQGRGRGGVARTDGQPAPGQQPTGAAAIPMNGSYQCQYQMKNWLCDVCKRMLECYVHQLWCEPHDCRQQYPLASNLGSEAEMVYIYRLNRLNDT